MGWGKICLALMLLAVVASAQTTNPASSPASTDNTNCASPQAIAQPAGAGAPGVQKQAREVQPAPPPVQQAKAAPTATPAVTPQLPNAPSVYVPLTKRQKFDVMVHRSYSPYTFAGAAFSATWAQMMGDWYDYGGGMEGWGKRFGASMADAESRNFFYSFMFPVIFHQDPRYFRSNKKGLIPRAWYAGTRVLVTRADDGHNTFNTSEILASAFTASLQNAYYPERDRGFEDTMSRMVGSLSSEATSNLLREFWPDIHRIFKKHEPHRVQKLEERLPMEKIGRVTGVVPANTIPPPATTAPPDATVAQPQTSNCANPPSDRPKAVSSTTNPGSTNSTPGNPK